MSKSLDSREKIEARLQRAPEIELTDIGRSDWEKMQADRDGGMFEFTLDFAERWARLIQVQIAGGASFEDAATVTREELAQAYGATGYQVSWAVVLLASCWKHGEELRRWHNLDAQLGDEGEKANESGGVLNPAMLKVG